jgi:5'-3' exonuclease
MMEGTSPQRATVNIGETAKKHKGIISNLLVAHALTGCDTVGSYHGIGKVTAVKILVSGHHFASIGDQSSDTAEVIK